MRLAAHLALSITVAISLVASACTDGHSRDTTSSSTTAAATESPLLRRPLPSPVTVRDQPEGTLTDPAFTALPGARAEYGRLGGSTYQIERTKHWNGQLVLWMHGFDEFSGQLTKDSSILDREWVRVGCVQLQ